jgi:hypothetical protein
MLLFSGGRSTTQRPVLVRIGNAGAFEALDDALFNRMMASSISKPAKRQSTIRVIRIFRRGEPRFRI